MLYSKIEKSFDHIWYVCKSDYLTWRLCYSITQNLEVAYYNNLKKIIFRFKKNKKYSNDFDQSINVEGVKQFVLLIILLKKNVASGIVKPKRNGKWSVVTVFKSSTSKSVQMILSNVCEIL